MEDLNVHIAKKFIQKTIPFSCTIKITDQVKKFFWEIFLFLEINKDYQENMKHTMNTLNIF